MPKGCIGHAGLDIERGREWRVHDDAARHQTCIEPIVDLGCVVHRHERAFEQAAKQRCPQIGDFIQREPASGEVGYDRQKPCARRGLEHKFARAEACCEPGHPCEAHGRRRDRRAAGAYCRWPAARHQFRGQRAAPPSP